MSGSQCPTIKPPDDPEILLSNYSTTVGTYVVISCRKFAYHVTPSAVRCIADGNTAKWNPTPRLTCEYGLNTQEQLLVGVFVSAGLLFLLCIICIVTGGVFGNNLRNMWNRYNHRGDYFDNQKTYPLEASLGFRGSYDDLDNPGRQYGPSGFTNGIDRYDNRNLDYRDYRDYRKDMYMNDNLYYDDRDVWRSGQYKDRDFLINRESFNRRQSSDYRDSREKSSDIFDKSPIWYTRQVIEYPENVKNSRENLLDDHDKPQIWYTRETIEYSDRETGYRFQNDFTDVQRYRDEPRNEPVAILDTPPTKSVVDVVPIHKDFTDFPRNRVERQKELVAILDAPPAESVVDVTEKVVFRVDHEPEYAEAEYQDLGFYALDKTPGSRVQPRTEYRDLGFYALDKKSGSHVQPHTEFQDLGFYALDKTSGPRVQPRTEHRKLGFYALDKTSVSHVQPRTEYQDLGFYALDKKSAGSHVHPRTIRNNPYIDNEPLYAKPFKSKFKVTIDGRDRRAYPDDIESTIRNNPYIDNREPLYAKPAKPKVKLTNDDVDKRVYPGDLETKMVHFRGGGSDVDQRFKQRRHRLRLRQNEAGHSLDRDPIVDENLDHVLYHGKGKVTEIYDHRAAEGPRLSASKLY